MRQIRPKTNGYSNVGRLEALEKRRREARERQAARDRRNDAEQIYELNRRPGNAARERARIAAVARAGESDCRAGVREWPEVGIA